MSIITCSLWCFLPERKQEVTNIMKKTILLLCLAGVLFIGIAAQNTRGATSANIHPQQQQSHTYHFSLSTHLVVRISQLDPDQYNSAADYQRWAYSTCSTAAMTEVINAYGHHYRIADLLTVQAQLGEITPTLGLTEDVGIARTAAKFSFSTSWGYNLSYDQVIAKANQGEPVIVGWPPQRYPGGHLVVVIGGNSQTVDIADSSRYDRHTLSRAQFMAWWADFSAVVTPLTQGGQA